MLQSPPSWRRGLKSEDVQDKIKKFGRLLLGGVDWNGPFQGFCKGTDVASFLEAWIEIQSHYKKGEWLNVASFLEAWIEIFMCQLKSTDNKVASFLEAWIEIIFDLFSSDSHCCRLLLGGVDWNKFFLVRPRLGVSRLLLGGVDWNNTSQRLRKGRYRSPPSRRRGLKSS